MLETPADPQTDASTVARTGHSLRMDSTTVSGYLRRLGLDDPGAPSAAALLVQRRDAAGVDRLVSCTLSRTEGSRTAERSLLSAGEWFAVLADLFFLTLDDIDTAGRLRLWERALSAQRAWEAGQE